MNKNITNVRFELDVDGKQFTSIGAGGDPMDIIEAYELALSILKSVMDRYQSAQLEKGSE